MWRATFYAGNRHVAFDEQYRRLADDRMAVRRASARAVGSTASSIGSAGQASRVCSTGACHGASRLLGLLRLKRGLCGLWGHGGRGNDPGSAWPAFCARIGVNLPPFMSDMRFDPRNRSCPAADRTCVVGGADRHGGAEFADTVGSAAATSSILRFGARDVRFCHRSAGPHDPASALFHRTGFDVPPPIRGGDAHRDIPIAAHAQRRRPARAKCGSPSGRSTAG
jgi:hypothetical protein